ncbi:MAG: hypothetical protein HQM00_10665 [Magnetococcales bacterium]|nr:hypothetical protein [Magnetococcales bacterium]
MSDEQEAIPTEDAQEVIEPDMADGGDDGIQTGHDDDSEVDVGSRDEAPSNPRQAALDRIAARRDAEVAGEPHDGRHDPNEEENERGESETPPQNQPSPKRRVADDQDLIQVVINGEIKEVPVAEVRSSFQIETAARQRMTQAALLDKALQDRAAYLAAREKELTAKEQQGMRPGETREATPGEQSPQKDTSQKAAKLHEALYSEDPKAIDQAMREYLQEVVTPPDATPHAVPVAEMVRTEVRKEQVYQQVAVAQRAIAKEFPDVTGDPIMAKLADDFVGAEYQRNPNQDVTALLRAGCAHARKIVSTTYQKVAQHTGAPSRIDLKRATTRLQAPIGTGRSVAAVKKQPREPTAREELAALRKMRGQ